jgi:hypothetical protein
MRAVPVERQFLSAPDLSTPAATVYMLLDHQDTLLSEQDDVFVAEHGLSAASADGYS